MLNAFVSYRSLLVLSELLHAAESNPGFQKCSGFHAKKGPLRKPQRKSETPAGDPEAAVPSQHYVSSDVFCYHVSLVL